VSEARPGEVRVFQRAADERWAVGVDAPELEGELRVATERDATPVARFAGQALAALRYADSAVPDPGEFAAARTALEQIRADLGAVLPYTSFSCAPLDAVQRLFDAARSEMEEQA
jgi:hypothetical protein